MMELQKAIYGRRSVRRYKKKRVPKKIMDEIIDAGLQAPASCNQQMFALIEVEDGKLRERLHKEANFKLLPRLANVYFVICDKRFGNERFANIQGTAALIHNMTLVAYSKGLGSLWMAGYGDKAIVKKLLKIPQHYHILGAVAFGYKDEKVLPPVKVKKEDIVFKNEFTKFQRNTKDPNEWGREDIIKLNTRSIFAKSPDYGYGHLFPLELEREVKYISGKLGKNVLSVYDISGLYLYELAKRNKNKKFTSLVWTKEARDWLQERARFFGLKNLKFIVKDLKDVKEKYDTVLLMDLINRIQDEMIDEILHSSRKVISKKGNIILGSLNKNSVYGFLFRKGVGRRYGPEISLSNRKVFWFINENKLKINDRRGFNLLPSPRLFFKMGVPGKYTLFNKHLRFLSKFDLLEGWSFKNFLKGVCTLNIFELRK